MIKHIVMWKITPQTNIDLLNRSINKLEDSFNNLHLNIPEVISISFHKNNKEDDNNFDYCLMVQVKDLKDLDIYSMHQAHLELVKIIKSLNFHRAAIDIIE